MIALLLIPLALAVAFGVSGVVDARVEEEADRIAEQNGLDDFDPDAPSIFDGRDVQVGDNEEDVLNGGNGADVLLGFGQSDILRGFAGDDLLDGGTNDDTLIGGSGDDTLGGGTGADRLVGDAGNDLLIGNNGDDTLIGREGDDLLIGGGDRDDLSGGDGDDLLISGLLRFEGEDEDLNLSATAALAIEEFGSGDFADADLEALRAEGAFNGVDIRFLSEAATAPQGGVVDGGEGDDVLVLTGGDRADGGAGEDTFVLNEDMRDAQTVFINDFSADEDVIAIEYDGAEPNLEIRDWGEDAVILIGEDVIARITGAAGLDVSALQLVTAEM